MLFRQPGRLKLRLPALISGSRRFTPQQIPIILWLSLISRLTVFGLGLTLAPVCGFSQYESWGAANHQGAPLNWTTGAADARVTDSDNADADELLRKVVSVYRGLSTYSDHGYAVVHLGADLIETVKFETIAKRPGKLRFAWTVQSNHTPGHKQSALIWCDGITAWSRYSFGSNQPEEKKDLKAAVTGALGASFGTAHSVPGLLFDEVGGIRLDALQRLKVTGFDTTDGVECFVIVGYLASGTERRIWVGRKDYLIRRIDERTKTFTKVETRKQIVVNQEIPDSRFSEQRPLGYGQNSCEIAEPGNGAVRVLSIESCCSGVTNEMRLSFFDSVQRSSFHLLRILGL